MCPVRRFVVSNLVSKGLPPKRPRRNGPLRFARPVHWVDALGSRTFFEREPSVSKRRVCRALLKPRQAYCGSSLSCRCSSRSSGRSGTSQLKLKGGIDTIYELWKGCRTSTKWYGYNAGLIRKAGAKVFYSRDQKAAEKGQDKTHKRGRATDDY